MFPFSVAYSLFFSLCFVFYYVVLNCLTPSHRMIPILIQILPWCVGFSTLHLTLSMFSGVFARLRCASLREASRAFSTFVTRVWAGVGGGEAIYFSSCKSEGIP